MKDISPRQRLK